MRHAAKGQWGGGMDLQRSIRQANSLRRVGALFATRTGTLWPNARNGTVRNVAKEDTRSAIAHIHEVEEGYFRPRRSIVLSMRRRLWYQLNERQTHQCNDGHGGGSFGGGQRHRTKDEYPLKHKVQSSVRARTDSACGLWYGLRGDRCGGWSTTRTRNQSTRY